MMDTVNLSVKRVIFLQVSLCIERFSLLRLKKQYHKRNFKTVLHTHQSFKSILLEMLGDVHFGSHRAVPGCHGQDSALAAWLSDSGRKHRVGPRLDWPLPAGTQACYFIASFTI